MRLLVILSIALVIVGCGTSKRQERLRHAGGRDRNATTQQIHQSADGCLTVKSTLDGLANLDEGQQSVRYHTSDQYLTTSQVYANPTMAGILDEDRAQNEFLARYPLEFESGLSRQMAANFQSLVFGGTVTEETNCQTLSVTVAGGGEVTYNFDSNRGNSYVILNRADGNEKVHLSVEGGALRARIFTSNEGLDVCGHTQDYFSLREIRFDFDNPLGEPRVSIGLLSRIREGLTEESVPNILDDLVGRQVNTGGNSLESVPQAVYSSLIQLIGGFSDSPYDGSLDRTCPDAS